MCHVTKPKLGGFSQRDTELSVPKWPTRSLDLNPVEHLLDVVKQENDIMDLQATNLK